MPNTLPEAVQADLRLAATCLPPSCGGVGGVALIGTDPKTKQATAVGEAAVKIN